MDRLPLFPLNTVLFPRAPLPLHIFEERYRLMIGRCIDESAPFGVVLIRAGKEVGGHAEPYDVGTTARVARVQRLPDGRMNIICAGRRRFRIVELHQDEPYLTGDVGYLEVEGADTAEAQELAGRASALLAEHYRLALAITGQWARKLDLPSQPDRVADFVATQLEIPAVAKQRLLETLSVPACLREEEEVLGESIRKLSERWEDERAQKFAGAALN